MKLEVVGSGCPGCERLYNWIKKLVKEGKLDAKVSYSTDVNKLIEAGAIGSPGLFKDGNLINVGIPGSEEILFKIIKEQ